MQILQTKINKKKRKIELELQIEISKAVLPHKKILFLHFPFYTKRSCVFPFLKMCHPAHPHSNHV